MKRSLICIVALGLAIAGPRPVLLCALASALATDCASAFIPKSPLRGSIQIRKRWPEPKRRQRELRALIEDYVKGAVRPVVIPEISDQNRT